MWRDHEAAGRGLFRGRGRRADAELDFGRLELGGAQRLVQLAGCRRPRGDRCRSAHSVTLVRSPQA